MNLPTEANEPGTEPRPRQRLCWALWGCVFLAGCGVGSTDDPEDSTVPELLASQYNPQTTGTIRGRVIWDGAVPDIPPLHLAYFKIIGPPLPEAPVANPNAPVVDPESHGVANAVVFLRGIHPRESKPWSHVPVEVELHDFRIDIRQQKQQSRVGFVRRGDAVTMVSRQSTYHSLHAEGASFFTLTFPDPDQSLTRTMPQSGVMELTSAAGYFWMRAYLFVDDHPYYACTDSKGRFELTDVPPGLYEIVCWKPSWKTANRDRDPENGQIVRLDFGPPVTIWQSLRVQPHAEAEVNFALREADFKP